jgi:hypothetical protein
MSRLGWVGGEVFGLVGHRRIKMRYEAIPEIGAGDVEGALARGDLAIESQKSDARCQILVGWAPPTASGGETGGRCPPYED